MKKYKDYMKCTYTCNSICQGLSIWLRLLLGRSLLIPWDRDTYPRRSSGNCDRWLLDMPDILRMKNRDHFEAGYLYVYAPCVSVSPGDR